MMAFALGHISGGHFNPVVMVRSRFVLHYMGVQVLDGHSWRAMLYVIASGNPAYSLATNG